jgi:hypothetical protein
MKGASVDREEKGPVEVSRTATVRAGGIRFVIGQIRAERVRFALMRLSFAAVLLLNLLLTAWALPWFPFGTSVDDYTAGTVITVLMAMGCSVVTVLFVLVWAPQFKNEPLPEFLRVLFGASQLIRSPAQFQSRLSAECRRARRDKRHTFSLIVAQLPNGEASEAPKIGEHEEARHYAAMLVRSAIRAEDIVGDSWPREVWVLSVGAGPEARDSILRRLAHALATSEGTEQPLTACRIGGSTFGHDGEEVSELFSSAYKRLGPLTAYLELRAAA